MEKANFLNQFDITSYQRDNSSITINTNGTPKIRVDICELGIVRIWVDPLGLFKKGASPAVINESWEYDQYELDEDAEYLKIYTQLMGVKIHKKSLRIDFYNSQDRSVITSEYTPKGLGWGDDGQVFLYHNLAASEHIYGLGQDNDAHLGNFDRRATKRDMLTGQTITKGCVTADIPITFFMSTGEAGGGYGMFVDNSYHMEFNMGEESPEYYYWMAQGGELLYYMIAGPAFSHILDRFTQLTGRPSLPPLWALGFIQSKCAYHNWEEMDDVIQTTKEKNIPLDVMVFDFDWAEDMMNFKWHPRWQGLSPEKIGEYKQQGIKFLISNSGPMLKKSCSNYQDALASGILATDGRGNTVSCGHYGGDLMDFTAPNIKQWLWQQIQPLYDSGIDGWWLDLTEPEGEPIQTVYQGGPKERIHNIYSLLCTKTYYEMQKDYAPDSRPFILTRTGTAGIQRYGSSIWTGDVFSDYQTFMAHCPEALNATLSGIAYWTCDAGGFISSTYDNASGTHIHLYKNDLAAHGLLYERWMQFACFTPITRAHHVGPASPYMFGEHVEASCKHYLQLRYQLLPYIYAYAVATSRTGAPIMRPLIFDYQDDANTYAIRDQYLFGSELLVAPVFSENTSARKVYFPKGTWIDYDYGYEYEGSSTHNVYAPQNRIPLFVKSGSIIPMIPLMQCSDEKEWDTVILDIYPDKTSQFVLYQDDGKTMAFANEKKYTETKIHCEQLQNVHIAIDIQESNKYFTPKTYQLKLHLKNTPTEVCVDQVKLELFNSRLVYDQAQCGWWWDKLTSKLYVKIATNKQVTYHAFIALSEQTIAKPMAPQIQLGTGMAYEDESANKEAQLPYILPAASVPCRIQAENYDRGGEGVAYHMTLPYNLGNQYRKDDVNIEVTSDLGGGYNVFGLTAGEWLEYTIHVAEPKNYQIALRIASESGGRWVVHAGGNQTTIDVDATGGRQIWQTVTVENIALAQGEQVLKLLIDRGSFNLNFIEMGIQI